MPVSTKAAASSPVWQSTPTAPNTWPVALWNGTSLTGPWTMIGDRLATRSLHLASRLHSAGVRSGERVSLLLAPGPARTAVAYACWRIGAVVVATSPELTPRECWRAHRQARPGAIIACGPGLTITRAERTPPRQALTVRHLPLLDCTLFGANPHLSGQVAHHECLPLPAPPAPDDDAAVLFALDHNHNPVGVFYTHADLNRLCDIVAELLTARPPGATQAGEGTHPRPPLSHLRTETGWVAASLILPGDLPALWRATLASACAGTSRDLTLSGGIRGRSQ